MWFVMSVRTSSTLSPTCDRPTLHSAFSTIFAASSLAIAGTDSSTSEIISRKHPAIPQATPAATTTAITFFQPFAMFHSLSRAAVPGPFARAPLIPPSPSPRKPSPPPPTGRI